MDVPGLSHAASVKAAAKQAEEQQHCEAVLKAAGSAFNSPRPSYSPLTPDPHTVEEFGIMDVRQPPYSGFDQVNEWDGNVGGHYVNVHAGAMKDPTTADPVGVGVIVVTTVPGGTESSTNVTLPDPSTKGPFTITAADAPQLTLCDATGKTVHFNVETHNFDN